MEEGIEDIHESSRENFKLRETVGYFLERRCMIL
jgi:hypothetical protein